MQSGPIIKIHRAWSCGLRKIACLASSMGMPGVPMKLLQPEDVQHLHSLCNLVESTR